jgi:hypothetical protein
VVSAPGDSADLVERAGAGFACPPEDWRALAERFRQVATVGAAERAELGRRARASYEAQMSKRAGVDQLEDMLVEAGGRR